MALTRKSLKAMGLTDEQVDSIVEMHTETVDGLKEAAKKAEADAKALPGVQKQLDELAKELEAAKKDGWKDKHDAVKKEFDDYKAAQTAKENRSAKEAAYRELLKAAGISEKRIDRVIKSSGAEIDALELEDGKAKDADKLTSAIKEEWADFIVKTETTGALTSNPPANGERKAMSREEIYKKDDKGRYLLDATARQQALAANMAQNE